MPGTIGPASVKRNASVRAMLLAAPGYAALAGRERGRGDLVLVAVGLLGLRKNDRLGVVAAFGRFDAGQLDGRGLAKGFDASAQVGDWLGAQALDRGARSFRIGVLGQ